MLIKVDKVVRDASKRSAGVPYRYRVDTTYSTFSETSRLVLIGSTSITGKQRILCVQYHLYVGYCTCAHLPRQRCDTIIHPYHYEVLYTQRTPHSSGMCVLGINAGLAGQTAQKPTACGVGCLNVLDITTVFTKVILSSCVLPSLLLGFPDVDVHPTHIPNAD